MFSVAEKRFLAETIESALLSLKHPEMPTEQLSFALHVDGKEKWSWADIDPNWVHEGSNPNPPNPWNEISREVLGTDTI